MLSANTLIMVTDNYRKHTSTNPLQQFLLRRFHDVLLAELRAVAPRSVLDVGCGEGFTLELLRQKHIGERLEGIDFLQRAIDIGRELHPELTLKQGDIYQLPYPDGAFDAVICCEVLEHLEHPERAMRELQRVVKKYCIISVPNEPFFRAANFLRGKNLARWGNDREHIQHWSKRGIKNFVKKYFNIKTVKTPFPWTLVVGEN